MESCPEHLGVNVKEEVVDPPPIVIKPEPISPERCTRVHPPAAVHPPASLRPATPDSSAQIPSRPVGRFAPSKAAKKLDKAVDLSSYQYGLYSFYAEGNETREYDAPHFDPYYGETDMKDPTLLARAKRYFENLRREQCEELDEFHMREQTSSTTREHRPMYQRKRKKVQKLVVLVPKIRISHTIQEFLRKRYPPDSDRAARWAARKKCRSAEGTLQEKKLQEFMTQFQSGTSHSKSRPYSVSQRVANLDTQSRPPSSCSSQQSSSTCHEMTSNPQSLEQDIDRHNEDKSISSSLAPMERLIKCEMMDYENISPNENPLLTVKREMLECPHHNTHVKSEPIDYSESECVRNHPNKMPRTDSEQNSSATSSLLSENVASTDYEQPPSTLHAATSQNSENITPNIQPLGDPNLNNDEETKKRKSKKHKRPCLPFPIKQEPLEETATELEGSLSRAMPTNDASKDIEPSVNTDTTPDSVIQPTNNNEEENTIRKKKKHRRPCIPFPIKQEPVEETATELEGNLSRAIPTNDASEFNEPPVDTDNMPENLVHPTLKNGEENSSRNKKKPKRPCIPFSVKQEPVEETRSESNSSSTIVTDQSSEAKEGENVARPKTVKIKQEQLEPDQMRMVEIFRKRVKKLKKIEVKPLVAVKEEPVDFEEMPSELPSPEIKEEPAEATLLYIAPKPSVEQKNAKKLKYVYGRRMQGRARMSASHPRGRTSLDVMEESEFDSAAKLDTPFSPPKSAWSKITPSLKNAPESDEETEENRGLTAQIDRLIEAGNIQTLDDTETMYSLFASAIKDIQDPKANVFNIVLERFKENKAFEKSLKSAEEENNTSEPETLNPEDETPKTPALLTLFPMSDQEIYNQGLAVVGETKPPEQFELPSVKLEEFEEGDKGEAQDVMFNSELQVGPEITDALSNTPDLKDDNPDLMINSDTDFDRVPGNAVFKMENQDAAVIAPHQTGSSPDHVPPSSDFSRISPIRIRNSLDRLNNKPNILKASSANPFQSEPPTTATSDFDDRPPPLYIDAFSKTRRGSDEKIRVVDESSEDFRENGSESVGYKSDERPPTSTSRPKGDMSEAERLFDEMLADEQATFQNPEPTYMEPFPRNDSLFANTSLDDFIKAPLSSNEHLVKPKPSYVRMNYHDSSESVDTFKPPTVLFSSKPEDLAPKENPEWNQWKRQHESFDQFQSSSWGIDEQSNSWSPQHSIYDQYLEPPSHSAPFEEHQKDSSRMNCFESNPLSPWVDGRRLSVQSTFPIIERNESGQEIVRIPVEQRTVQTQFPNHSKHCPAIEISPPVLTFIVQRQDNVVDIAIQTDMFPPYSPFLDYGHHSPLGSVLVEPLLSARKVSRPSPRTPTTEEKNRVTAPTIQQRTCQTQYPANNSLYSPFEPSVPFQGYLVTNKEPSDSCTQTEGAPLFPPWVAPGRFRRHRPVLVEPLPNIEPIGENVRTMRSSDAYSILMEQIRTSNDPSFDKFMNSQQQPNGVVSRFNKYACYAPQGNSPELPLTVKKNYPKKSGNVCKGKRPGIEYKEVSPQQVPSEHSNRGLTPYQISVKIRRMGQVENIIGRLSTPKKRNSLSPKR